MKYGEIQAVVQLAVGLNIGIFVLTDLAVPYLQRQRKDLADLRIFLGQVNDKINGLPEGPERDTKKNQIENLMGRLIRILPKSSDLRKGIDLWMPVMTVTAAIMTIVSFILLFLTAKWYDCLISHESIFYGLIILFLPLACTVLVMILARVFGKGVVKEQEAIRAELADFV